MNSASRSCPALFISAPASGQGKTTITAALARLHARAGRRVRVFKTGPDFLDPMIHEQASGQPVYQLDLWMGGEQHCRELLYCAAADAHVILIEGVMGLFDGEPSSADVATLFGIPVLAVINATAMAQTFGAIAHGMATYRTGLPWAGVLANHVASDSHANLLRESLSGGMRWFGALLRNDKAALPSRHLGLVQAEEITDLMMRLDAAADALAATALDLLPPAVEFNAVGVPLAVPCIDAAITDRRAQQAAPLRGTRIAIAQDRAFSFLYHANVDCLRELGAEITYFSPLLDQVLPDCDAVYLPGGYPELHLQTLAGNTSMKNALAEHHVKNKPLLAECGGLLYLLSTLTDCDGHEVTMAGLLHGDARMQRKLANLGLHSVHLPEGSLRGHTYHHSLTESTLKPFAWTEGKRGKPEPWYRQGRLQASYLHLYFPSNPEAVARLFTP